MHTSNRKHKQKSVREKSVRGGAIATLISTVLLIAGCSGGQTALPSDEVLIDQWQREQAQMLEQIEACQQEERTYSLSDRYQETDNLIALGSLEGFEGCSIAAPPAEGAYPVLHLAKKENLYLLVTAQNRKGTGWVEEKASQWTGGWVSWKASILEEKGLVYAPGGLFDGSSSPLPISGVSPDPLDRFSGRYRPTSQVSGNSSCEIWMLRPIEADWYLFYHQARECPA